MVRFRARQYITESTFGVSFAGWEWGNFSMASWFASRCSGEEGEARCARTGHYLSGKITPEQLAEEWQEEATKVRKEFYAGLGMAV